jgi:hypothetical protein
MEGEEDELEVEVHFADANSESMDHRFPTRGGTLEEMECSEWIGRGLKLFNESVTESLRKISVISSNRNGLDTKELLQLVQTHWFRLNQGIPMNGYEKSIFSEIRQIRNSWAHQVYFDANDTYRALDTLERAVGVLNIYEAFCRLREVKRRFLPRVYRQIKQIPNPEHMVSTRHRVPLSPSHLFLPINPQRIDKINGWMDG